MSGQDNKAYRLSRTVMALGVIWFVFCAIAFSDAGFSILFVLLALPVTFVWSLLWLIRLALSMKRQNIAGFKNNLSYWLFEPVVIVLPLILALTGVFSSVRFVLSEQALSSYAENVRAGKVDLEFEFNHPARHVGLYTVTFTDLLADGTVRMLTSSHGVLDRAGFANSPANPPLKQGEDSYKHIHRQWWYWYESW